MNARMSFPITMLLRLEGGTQTSGNDESKGQASFGIFDKISQSYLQFLKSASFFTYVEFIVRVICSVLNQTAAHIQSFYTKQMFKGFPD